MGPDTETGGTVSTPNTPNPAGPWAAMVGATGSRYLEIAVAHIDALVAVDLAVMMIRVVVHSILISIKYLLMVGGRLPVARPARLATV